VVSVPFFSSSNGAIDFLWGGNRLWAYGLVACSFTKESLFLCSKEGGDSLEGRLAYSLIIELFAVSGLCDFSN